MPTIPHIHIKIVHSRKRLRVAPRSCARRFLERVMNSAGKPHRNANVSVSSVLRRSPVFRISKPFLSKFITASRARPRMGPPRVGAQRGLEKCSQGDVTAARDGPKQGPGEAQTPPGGGAGDTGAPGAPKGP